MLSNIQLVIVFGILFAGIFLYVKIAQRDYRRLIQEDNTEALCHEINSSFTIKAIMYILVCLLFLFIGHDGGSGHAGNSTSHEVLDQFIKITGTAILSLLPLIWDYARCETQNYWNRELRKKR